MVNGREGIAGRWFARVVVAALVAGAPACNCSPADDVGGDGGSPDAGGTDAGGAQLSDAKAITAFSVVTPPAHGVVDEATRSITVDVPCGTDVTALTAAFATTGTSVTIGGTPQVSGQTPNDFTHPVAYTVHAEDGSTVTYTATVTVAAPRASTVQSAFDIDDEGWVPYLNGGATQYSGSGGNPGGYVSVYDVTSDWAYLKAPAKFSGSAMPDGGLSFDLRVVFSATYPSVYKVRAALVGGELTIINEASLPTESWATYSFRLNATDGWRLATTMSQNYSADGGVPSAAQMATVLENLSALYIATDYNGGSSGLLDFTALDNVRLDVALCGTGQ